MVVAGSRGTLHAFALQRASVISDTQKDFCKEGASKCYKRVALMSVLPPMTAETDDASLVHEIQNERTTSMLSHEVLIAYFADALEPAERSAVEIHLATDPEGQRALAHQRLMDQALRVALAGPEADERVKQSVLTVVRASSIERLRAQVMAETDAMGLAIRAYGRAVYADPKVPLHHFNLGLALRKIGSFERATVLETARSCLVLLFLSSPLLLFPAEEKRGKEKRRIISLPSRSPDKASCRRPRKCWRRGCNQNRLTRAIPRRVRCPRVHRSACKESTSSIRDTLRVCPRLPC